MKTLNALALCAFLTPSCLLAQTSAQAPHYVAFSIGMADVELEELGAISVNEDDSDTAFGIAFGTMADKHFGFEVGHRTLYSEDGEKISGLDFGILLLAPEDEDVTLYGKFGLFRWSFDSPYVEDSSSRVTIPAQSSSGMSPYFGFGLDFKVDNEVSVGFEWLRYSIDPDIRGCVRRDCVTIGSEWSINAIGLVLRSRFF